VLNFCPALRSANISAQYNSVKSRGEDLNYGFLPYPKLLSSPSGIAYREKDNTLVITSEEQQQIVFVDVNTKRVYRRLSNANEISIVKPTYPTIYLPPQEAVVCKSAGGISSDGLIYISKTGNVSTLATNGGNSGIGEIVDAVYSPKDQSIYLVDESNSNIHRVNSFGKLDINYISLTVSTDNISQIDIDEETNTIFVSDIKNRKIQIIKDPTDSPFKSSVDIDFNFIGAAWSRRERKLYVLSEFAGIDSSFFNWDGSSLTKESSITIAQNDNVSVVKSLRYDFSRELIYAKVDSGTLNNSYIVYLNIVDNELRVIEEVQIKDPITSKETYSKSPLSLFITQPSEDSIREYKIIQSVVSSKTIPSSPDILEPINFSLLRGFVAIEGLKLSILNDSFQFDSSNFINRDLQSLYSFTLDRATKVLSAKWIEANSVQSLLLTFDNNTILALSSSIISLNTSNIKLSQVEAVDQSGNSVIVNPNDGTDYQPIDMSFSESMKTLFIAFSNGKLQSQDSTDNGIVLAYDVSQGINDPILLGYIEAEADTEGGIDSITLNDTANLLYVFGKGNRKLVIYDSREISLKGSKGLNNITNLKSNSVLFNNEANVIGVDNDEIPVLNSLKTNIISDPKTKNLSGSFTKIEKSDEYGFLYTLDKQSNLFYVLTKEYKVYSIVHLSNNPRTLLYLDNYLYIPIEQETIQLPDLKSEIPTNTAGINLVEFSSPVNISLGVGETITLKVDEDDDGVYDDIYYLITLSVVEPEPTVVLPLTSGKGILDELSQSSCAVADLGIKLPLLSRSWYSELEVLFHINLKSASASELA